MPPSLQGSNGRRRFLATLAGAAAASLMPATAAAAAARTRRPNIVVIVVDDATTRYLSCYGGRTPTPALDRVARDGARFQQAHAVAALCNPSRFVLLTGLHPSRNPAVRAESAGTPPWRIDQNTLVDESTPTLARLLRPLGYQTAYIGKWHSNFDLGPDVDRLPRDLDPASAQGDAFLRRRHEATRAALARLGGFDHVDRVVLGNLDAPGAPPALARHRTDWITDGALRWLDTAARDRRPFFLHLANTVPHGPQVWNALQEPSPFTPGGRVDGPLEGHPGPGSIFDRLRAARLPTAGPIGSINAGMIQVDDQVAAIQARLRRHGIERDTLLVFVADHGIYGKGCVYLGGSHVPCLISWPARIPGGQIREDLLSLADLAPTILAAAGAPPAAAAAMDGLSHLDALASGSPGPRPFADTEMGHSRGLFDGRWHLVSWRPPPGTLDQARTGAATLLPDHLGRTPGIFGPLNARYKPGYFDADQLYDAATDPFERQNLLEPGGTPRDSAHRPVLDRLRAALAERTRARDDAFPADADPWLASPAARELAQASFTAAIARPYHPQGHDAERIYNLNLDDPDHPVS